MKKVIILFLGAFLLSGCFYVSGQNRTPKHIVSETVRIGDLDRTYHLFMPENAGKEPMPLVFVFHGGGGTGLRMERWLGFTELARKERFIVVYPDGIGNNWNDGRITKQSKAHREQVNDLGFVEKMLDRIKAKYPIDSKRIFATGISNGGIFSHYIAANMSEDFAAIAPVVGGIADPFHKSFSPKNPVSVFIIQGTSDRLVPYDGGTIPKNRGEVIATDEAVRLWSESNNTDKTPIRGELADTDKNDGSKVLVFTYKNGAGGSEVVLYRIVGGGHTWPGASQYLPRFLIGNVCRDFDASQVIWEFFRTHPKQ